ncbi:autotransporter family protein [Bordetella sp. 02P26C-1]|uniref:autotransporter family protein n=1 Tax=Bordetella sp. 02P26C-1 TaxID=2683195 RepID=UPI001352E80C|nr:autotransporter outer membrane beta-barrel domain-containing protein [Bordetella sp. 02P26C-1]MVW80135.1 autotransporter outer membrane beta-barrel domain-containing protein [Bordetella sp. 02P26C-1]
MTTTTVTAKSAGQASPRRSFTFPARFPYKTFRAAILALAIPCSASAYAQNKTLALRPAALQEQTTTDGWFSYSSLANTVNQAAKMSSSAWSTVAADAIPYGLGVVTGGAVAWGKDKLGSLISTAVQADPVTAGVSALVAIAATAAARQFEQGVYITDQIAALPETVTETVSQYMPTAFNTGVTHGYNAGTVGLFLNDLNNLRLAHHAQADVIAAQQAAAAAQAKLLKDVDNANLRGTIAAAFGMQLPKNLDHAELQKHVAELKSKIEGLDASQLNKALAQLQRMHHTCGWIVRETVRQVVDAKSATATAAKGYRAVMKSDEVQEAVSRLWDTASEYWEGGEPQAEPNGVGDIAFENASIGYAATANAPAKSSVGQQVTPWVNQNPAPLATIKEESADVATGSWSSVATEALPYGLGVVTGGAVAWGKDKLDNLIGAVAEAAPVAAGVTALAAITATAAARRFEQGVYITDQIAALPEKLTETVSQYMPAAFTTGLTHGQSVATVTLFLNDLNNLRVTRDAQGDLAAAQQAAAAAQAKLLTDVDNPKLRPTIGAAVGMPVPKNLHPAELQDLVGEMKSKIEGLGPSELNSALRNLQRLNHPTGRMVREAVHQLADAKSAATVAAKTYRTVMKSDDVQGAVSNLWDSALEYWDGGGSQGGSNGMLDMASDRASIAQQAVAPRTRPELVSTTDNQLVVWNSTGSQPADPVVSKRLALPDAPSQPSADPGMNDRALVVWQPSVQSVVADESSGNQLVPWTPVEQPSDPVVPVSGQLALPAPAQQAAPTGTSAGEPGANSRALVVANAADGTDPQQELARAPVLSLDAESKPALPAVSAPAPEPGMDPSSSEIPESAGKSEIFVMDVAEEEEQEDDATENDAAEDDAAEDDIEADVDTEQSDEAETPLEQVAPPVVTMPPPPSAQDMAIRPEAGAYNGNARAANTMFQMSLSDRLGSYNPNAAGSQRGNAWVRYSGSRSQSQDSTGQLKTTGDQNTVMMGVDMLKQSNHTGNQFTAGVMGGYGHYAGETRSNRLNSSASGKVDGHGFGLYGTFQQNTGAGQGIYADSWLMWNRFDNRAKGANAPAQKYDAQGVTGSVEVGYNVKLAERANVKYLIQPRTQAIYQNVRSKNLHQADGTNVKFENSSRVQTTVAVRAAAQIRTGLTTMVTPHIEASWLHTSKGYGVKTDEAKVNTNSGRKVGQLKLGVQGEVNRNVSLNAGLFHSRGNDRYRETGGNVSLTYRY